MKMTLRQPGVVAALGAALLFGAATPLAKRLLQTMDSWLLAGILYLGAGFGLAIWRRATQAAPIHMPGSERLWFAGAIVSGGIVAPVLLMFGLAGTPAS